MLEGKVSGFDVGVNEHAGRAFNSVLIFRKEEAARVDSRNQHETTKLGANTPWQ